MRKLGLLASGVGLAVCAMACTAILGDFKVGAESDAGDAGGSDGPTGDTGPDAPPPLKPLNCTLNMTQLTTISFASTTAPIESGDRIYVYQLPNKKWRTYIEAHDTIWFGDFSDSDSTMTLSALTETNTNLVASSRYQDASGSGVVFLTYDQGTNNVDLITYDDSASSPQLVGKLLAAGTLPTLSTSSGVRGSIATLNSGTKDYAYVLEYSTDGTNYTLAAGHNVNGAPAGNLLTLGQNQGPDAPQYAITRQPGTAYVFWVNGASGPPTGPSQLYTIDIPSWTLVGTPRNLQPSTTGIYSPLALAPGGGPTVSDLAFIEGDFANQNTPPIIHSQAIQTNTLGTFDPSTVLGSSVPFTTLPFNKGVFHWVQFPTEDELVGAGRPLGDGPGVNLMWFDSLGRERALISETDGGSGFPSTAVNTVDFSFNGPPTAVFAQIRLAWIEGQSNTLSPPVYSAPATCLP